MAAPDRSPVVRRGSAPEYVHNSPQKRITSVGLARAAARGGRAPSKYELAIETTALAFAASFHGRALPAAERSWDQQTPSSITFPRLGRSPLRGPVLFLRGPLSHGERKYQCEKNNALRGNLLRRILRGRLIRTAAPAVPPRFFIITGTGASTFLSACSPVVLATLSPTLARSRASPRVSERPGNAIVICKGNWNRINEPGLESALLDCRGASGPGRIHGEPNWLVADDRRPAAMK